MSNIFTLKHTRAQWKLLSIQLLVLFCTGVFFIVAERYLFDVAGWINTLILTLLLTAANYFITSALWSAKRLFGFTWYPRTIGFGLLTGFLSFWVYSTALGFIEAGSVSGPSLFFIQIIHVFIIGNAVLLVFSISWFLMNSEVDHLDWFQQPYILSAVFFWVMYIFLGQASYIELILLPVLIAITFYAALYLHKNPRRLLFHSRFYASTTAVLFLVLISYSLSDTSEYAVYQLIIIVNWLLLCVYAFLLLMRAVFEKRFYLFQLSERVHLRLTGSILVTGLIIQLFTYYISPVFAEPTTVQITIYTISVLLTGILIIIYLLSKKITAPLHQFQSGLQKITSGAFDTIIPIETKDEVGELAHAYNMMVYRLKDLQSELASTERQAAFSEMARQVAHEIKNPLTPMKLKIQHLQRSFQQGKTATELAPLVKTVTAELIDQIESLDNIARSFSKYAKPITSDFQHVDLNTIVDDVLTLYRHEDKIKLLIDHSDNPLICDVAVEEWKRILINLINNSSDAMPEGGVIIIRLYPHGNQAYLEVVDNGEGIAVEDKPKIFTPNFSTKSSGTGLGLAITKKLVEAMKGEIQFASAKGAGTTFTLSFPLIR